MRMTKLADAALKNWWDKYNHEMKGVVRRDGKLLKMIVTRHCHYCSDSK